MVSHKPYLIGQEINNTDTTDTDTDTTDTDTDTENPDKTWKLPLL